MRRFFSLFSPRGNRRISQTERLTNPAPPPVTGMDSEAGQPANGGMPYPEPIPVPVPEYSAGPESAMPSVSSDTGYAESGKRIISSLFSNLWRNAISSVEEDPDLFSAMPVRSGLREEDAPLRRGGFSGEQGEGGEIHDASSETFRLLLDRAGEAKEILSRLNETADEIRRELTT